MEDLNLLIPVEHDVIQMRLKKVSKAVSEYVLELGCPSSPLVVVLKRQEQNST